MTIALLVGRDEEDKHRWQWFITEWQQALLALDPGIDIRVWPDVSDFESIDYALVWRHPLGSLSQFPNLKGIASLGAGVDHLMIDPDILKSKHVPIVRVTDPYMASDIVQYVVATTLHHIKRLDKWEANQKKSLWDRKPPFNFINKTVGIMGLGFLGQKAATALKSMDLKVIGWSNSPKELPGVQCFSGKNEFENFLSQTDVLICMLPLTKDTQNILNKNTFSLLRQDAFIINLGRGEHLVDEDLIAALDEGKLSGSYLDVFRIEPLPTTHPFWQHPKVQLTPHIASVTNAATAAPQVLDNYRRAMANQELLNRVDLSKGY